MEFRPGLIVASIVFALFLIWRFRPALGSAEPRERPLPKELAARLESTPPGPAFAQVLFEAGVHALGTLRYGRAESYFRRALRVDPGSAALVARVAEVLTRRPLGLERLLWRRLAQSGGNPEHREATAEVVLQLAKLYQRTPHQRIRAEALRHWLSTLAPEKAEQLQAEVEISP